VDTLYDEIDDTLLERRIDTVDYSSGAGTTYGIDGRLRVNQNLSVSVMGLGSHTSEPESDGLLRVDTTFDYDSKTVALDGESFGGHALFTQFNWGSRYWDWTLTYEEESPTFRSENGWITANDRRQLNFWTGLTFNPNRPWLVTWGPRMQMGRVYNHRAPVPAHATSGGGRAFISVLKARLI
jgi:hypothetical protein